jgi:hypothetical protein
VGKHSTKHHPHRDDSLPANLDEWRWTDSLMLIVLTGAIGFLAAWGAIFLTAYVWWTG